MSNHGGKRKNSGAKKIEGTEYKVKLSVKEKDILKDIYPEKSSTPKRIKEAIEDINSYRSKMENINSVGMEILNGKVEFYKGEVKEYSDKIMKVETEIPCKKIKYFKHSGRFEIDILVKDYFFNNLNVSRMIKRFYNSIKKIDTELCFFKEISTSSFTNKEGLKETELLIEDMSEQIDNFGGYVINGVYLKAIKIYRGKVDNFGDQLNDIQDSINKFKEVINFNDWVDKKFEEIFKENLRIRESSKNSTDYITYKELLEVIKHSIRHDKIIKDRFNHVDNQIRYFEWSDLLSSKDINLLNQLEEEINEKTNIFNLLNNQIKKLTEKKEGDQKIKTIKDLIVSIKKTTLDYHKEKSKGDERLPIEILYGFKEVYFVEDRYYNSKELREIKSYIKKIEGIHCKIFEKYREDRNEVSNELFSLLEKFKESLKTFETSKSEIAKMEIKPNSYVISY